MSNVKPIPFGNEGLHVIWAPWAEPEYVKSISTILTSSQIVWFLVGDETILIVDLGFTIIVPETDVEEQTAPGVDKVNK